MAGERVEFDERRKYVEELGILTAQMGTPPAYGKLLAWLLICDPPAQTSVELANALGLSKGSVSTGMRMLERSGLVRRVATAGRGHAYEMLPDAMIRGTIDAEAHWRRMAAVMSRGIELIGDEAAPQAQRLRLTRDFFAYIAEKVPEMVADFKRENGL